MPLNNWINFRILMITIALEEDTAFFNRLSIQTKKLISNQYVEATDHNMIAPITESTQI